MADVTRCYESIPLQGPDNLLDSISFIISTTYKHAALEHPKASTQLWVRINQDNTPVMAKWATCQPSSSNWFVISLQRLLKLHEWLMKNCYITLGDRVWVQCTGHGIFMLTYLV